MGHARSRLGSVGREKNDIDGPVERESKRKLSAEGRKKGSVGRGAARPAGEGVESRRRK